MRGFFTDNLPLKIISVVVGLVIYLFVMQEKEADRELTVPVRVINNIDGYVLRTEIPDLRVRVSGRTRNLAHLQTDTLEPVVVRLDETRPLITFSPADIPVPSGLEVRSIFPESLQLSYAHLTSRQVPISVNYHGRPHPDYSIANIQVTPEQITVSGPEEQIDDLNVIYTSRIDLYPSDTEDIRRRVELITLGSYMDYDRSVPIEVTIDLEPNQETVRIDQPVELRGPTERISLVDGSSYLTVWLVGPPTLMADRESLRFSAVIDTAELADDDEGRYFVEPFIINLPEGVRLGRFEPPSVPVDVGPRSTPLELTPVPVPVVGVLPLPLPPILYTP